MGIVALVRLPSVVFQKLQVSANFWISLMDRRN